MSGKGKPHPGGAKHRHFMKLTPVNGFDAENPDNAKQNNYAWSIAEMDGYLYVGTGRNIVYSVLASGAFGDIPIPDVFVPEHLDMNGEIWRLKLDRSGDHGGEWERVYKAPPELGIAGFRFMIPYTTPSGETALYAGCMTSSPEVLILKSTNGLDWLPLPTGIPGNSTRSMVIHEDKLYMATLGGAIGGPSEAEIYVSSDPERDGWERVDTSGDPDRNPRGAVVTMLSFNSHLYAATSPLGGFELWRTCGSTPQKDDWKLLVDRGAGDALNEIPLTIGAFGDHVYVGTAIAFAIASIDPARRFNPPKGFDLIRVDRSDRWELVVGGPPVAPTEPTTGKRGKALSGLPSGFGNITNAYCWQLQAHDGELYLGTLDWSVAVPPFLSLIRELVGGVLPSDIDIDGYTGVLRSYLEFLARYDVFVSLLASVNVERMLFPVVRIIERTFGFDLWKSPDGARWFPVCLDGLGNPYNYGLRNIFRSSNGDLYLGTANPFQGCEVWLQDRRRSTAPRDRDA